MADQVLWRRLTETDFRAVHGKAAPSGSGGGAVHIALAKPREDFKLDEFLGSKGKQHIEIATQPGPGHAAGQLSFHSNPSRRGGEWIIQDQYSHRHPAWIAAAGFPNKWDPTDPPHVFVFRVGTKFHVRWAPRSKLKAVAGNLPAAVFSKSVGIATVVAKNLPMFKLGGASLVEDFEDAGPETVDPFDPKDLEDARQRVFRSIRIRQGQPKFRKALLTAYGGRCAFTGDAVSWVLDAAHIVPYFGPKTNHVTNGLLLRSDVHTLFDLGLISVEPKSRKLRVAKRLTKTPYQALDGKPLREAKSAAARASPAALQAHFSTFEDA